MKVNKLVWKEFDETALIASHLGVPIATDPAMSCVSIHQPPVRLPVAVLFVPGCQRAKCVSADSA